MTLLGTDHQLLEVHYDEHREGPSLSQLPCRTEKLHWVVACQVAENDLWVYVPSLAFLYREDEACTGTRDEDMGGPAAGIPVHLYLRAGVGVVGE